MRRDGDTEWIDDLPDSLDDDLVRYLNVVPIWQRIPPVPLSAREITAALPPTRNYVVYAPFDDGAHNNYVAPSEFETRVHEDDLAAETHDDESTFSIFVIHNTGDMPEDDVSTFTLVSLNSPEGRYERVETKPADDDIARRVEAGKMMGKHLGISLDAGMIGTYTPSSDAYLFTRNLNERARRRSRRRTVSYVR
jgi:hypothetical protein